MKPKIKSKRAAKKEDITRFPLNEGKPLYDMDAYMSSGGKKLVPIQPLSRKRRR